MGRLKESKEASWGRRALLGSGEVESGGGAVRGGGAELTGKNVLVAVLALVLRPLAFQALVQVFYLLLLQTLKGERTKPPPQAHTRVERSEPCHRDIKKARWPHLSQLHCPQYPPQTPPRSQPWLCPRTPAFCSVPRPGSRCRLRLPEWRSKAGERKSRNQRLRDLRSPHLQQLRGREEAAGWLLTCRR